MGTAVSAILDIFNGFAMTPSLKPGKIAVLFTPRGRGSASWRKRLFWTLHECFLPLPG